LTPTRPPLCDRRQRLSVKLRECGRGHARWNEWRRVVCRGAAASQNPRAFMCERSEFATGCIADDSAEVGWAWSGEDGRNGTPCPKAFGLLHRPQRTQSGGMQPPVPRTRDRCFGAFEVKDSGQTPSLMHCWISLALRGAQRPASPSIETTRPWRTAVRRQVDGRSYRRGACGIWRRGIAGRAIRVAG
jgi:hypothetical protein